MIRRELLKFALWYIPLLVLVKSIEVEKQVRINISQCVLVVGMICLTIHLHRLMLVDGAHYETWWLHLLILGIFSVFWIVDPDIYVFNKACISVFILGLGWQTIVTQIVQPESDKRNAVLGGCPGH